jgi:FixJ family two-component response regulator
MTTERRKPLVVIVGEDPAVCRSIQHVTESSGISVDTFMSTHDFMWAIEAIASFVPDCVILNTRLSELNGFHVLDRLRRIRKTIPVICLTDPSDSPYPRVFFAAEQSASFEKPLDLDTFVATLLVWRFTNSCHIQTVRAEERSCLEARTAAVVHPSRRPSDGLLRANGLWYEFRVHHTRTARNECSVQVLKGIGERVYLVHASAAASYPRQKPTAPRLTGKSSPSLLDRVATLPGAAE